MDFFRIIKTKKEMNNNSGVTLIALVVTIVILLILAGISINLTLSNEGIIAKTKDAREAKIIASEKDVINVSYAKCEIDIYGEKASGTYTLNEELEKEIKNNGYDATVKVKGDTLIIRFVETGNQYELDDKGINKVDEIEENPEESELEQIKIGDYIEYDAGIWSDEQIESLKSKNLYIEDESLGYEKNGFKFGGFKANSSRNKTINIDENTKALADNPKFAEGWRVLSKSDDGSIKIVSAGLVEAYQHYSNATNLGDIKAGYYSEYILRRAINSKDTTHTEEDYIAAGANARDYTMYENSLAKPNSARCMNILEAYYITGSLDGTDNDLRNLGVFYHIASGQEEVALARVEPNGDIYMSGNTYYGIRIIIELKPTLKISDRNTGDGSSFAKAWKLELSE